MLMAHLDNTDGTIELNLMYPGACTFLKSKGRASGHLTIFCQKEGRWHKNEFSPGKTMIKIGSSSDKCDICIDGDESVDSIQTVIDYLGDTLFIVERGKNSITSINGEQTPQATFTDENPAFMMIGKTPFIIKPRRSTGVKSPDTEDTYLIKDTHGTESRCSFNRPQILGSNSASDIQLKAEGVEFVGMTFPIEGNLYLFPFANVKMNGEELLQMQLHLLPPFSQISNFGFSITLPTKHKSQTTTKIPSFTASCMKFMEVQPDEKVSGQKMNLPAQGKSFMISRLDDANCFFVNSNLVSRKQAQVIVYEKSILVEDCYSANGTFINGDKISRRSVHPGDFVSIGDKTFLLCYSLKADTVPV